MTKGAAWLLFSSVHFTVSATCRISFVCAQARIETEERRAIGADDLAGIAHLEVDVWVILRRFIPNSLELAAANAHDRHPDFIMKLWITFHLQRAERGLDQHPVSDAPSHRSVAVKRTHSDTSIVSFSHHRRGLEANAPAEAPGSPSPRRGASLRSAPSRRRSPRSGARARARRRIPRPAPRARSVPRRAGASRRCAARAC